MTGKASWSQSKCHKGTGYLSRFSLSPLVSRFHFISFHKHYSLSHSSSFLIFSFFIGFEKKNTEVFCASLNFHFIFFVRRDQSRKTMCGIVQPHTILLHFQVPSLLWKWLSCFLALAFPSLSNGCSVHWGMWVLFYFSLSFNGFHFISQSFLFFSFWGLLLIKSCKFFFFCFVLWIRSVATLLCFLLWLFSSWVCSDESDLLPWKVSLYMWPIFLIFSSFINFILLFMVCAFLCYIYIYIYIYILFTY